MKLTNVSSRYGAPMGRKSFYPAFPGQEVKLHLQKVPINSGGYDSGGAYWGLPVYDRSDDSWGFLYRAWSSDGLISFYLRSWSREAARLAILKDYPGAKILKYVQRGV